MYSFRQLFRQPMKTLSGVLLVGLAVAVLCVSFAQVLAAEQTTEMLKQTFKTVALTKGMTETEEAWMEQFCADNPQIITEDVNHLLASGYISALTQDNETAHLQPLTHMNDHYLSEPDTPVYSAAMLEITLTALDVQEGEETRYRPMEDGNSISGIKSTYDGYTVTLFGRIDRVIGLEEGYSDPTDFQLRIFLRTKDRQEYLDLGLEVGGRYLIYTEEYVDADFLLRNAIMNRGIVTFWEEGVEVPAWHMEALETFTDYYFDQDAYFQDAMNNPNGVNRNDYYVTRTGYKLRIGDLIYRVNGNQLEMFRTAEVTLENAGGVPTSVTTVQLDESGEIIQSETATDELYRYRDSEGAEQTMTWEEHGSRYENPVIVRLEGTAEEFLESEDGRLWKQALSDLQVNADTYPVIGVTDLRAYADFACGRATVSDGREFTEEEIETGANVCILSKSMAERCGLNVGDTIDIRYFTYDYANPYQDFIRDGAGLVNPTAYRYRSQTMELLTAQTYTIVGFYEQSAPWDNVDNNYFQFTPNTVFVPGGSITGGTDTAEAGMFRTLVVESDQMRTMQYLTVEADMDHLLYYYDNGYNDLSDSLDGFREAARQLLPLGLTVYAVLMILYLFLFPCQQGRNLVVMDAQGTGKASMALFVTRTAMGTLIPGSLLGCAAGVYLWEYVCDALREYMDAGVALTLDTASIWMVAACQCAGVCALAGLTGVVQSLLLAPMKRR